MLNRFDLPKTYRRYQTKFVSMTGWYIWQIVSVLNPLIFYSTFLYALVWSEVTGYNKLREEAIFNKTGVDKRFMNEWKYLTRWDHMVQLVFWFISVIATAQRLLKFKDVHSDLSNTVEVVKKLQKPTALQKFQDAFFHSLAHPLSIVITLLYWSMKLYDPSLLSGNSSPDIPDTPVLLDHIVHTVVSVSCFIEFFLTYHKRPAWWVNIITPLLFLLVWVLFDEYLKAYKGFAVYNVLNTTFYTLVIVVVAIVCVLLICLVLTKLHYLYWSEKRIDKFQLSPKLRSMDGRSYHA